MDSLRSRIPPIPQKNLEEMERMKRRNLSGLLSNIPEAFANLIPQAKAGKSLGLLGGMLVPKFHKKGGKKLSKGWDKDREKKAKEMLEGILQMKKAASSVLNVAEQGKTIWELWNSMSEGEKAPVRETIWNETGTDIGAKHGVLLQARSSKGSTLKVPMEELRRGGERVVRLGDIMDSPDFEAVEGLADMPVRLNKKGGGRYGGFMAYTKVTKPEEFKNPATGRDKLLRHWGKQEKEKKLRLGDDLLGVSKEDLINSGHGKPLSYPEIQITTNGMKGSEDYIIGLLQHEYQHHLQDKTGQFPGGGDKQYSKSYDWRGFGKRKIDNFIMLEEALNKKNQTLADMDYLHPSPNDPTERFRKGSFVDRQTGDQIFVGDLGLKKMIFEKDYGSGAWSGGKGRISKQDIKQVQGKSNPFRSDRWHNLPREHLSLMDDLKMHRWRAGLLDPQEREEGNLQMNRVGEMVPREETPQEARWRNYYATPGEMDARVVDKQRNLSLQQMKDDPYFLHRNKLTEQGGTGIHRSLHSLAKPLPVGYTDKGGSLLFQDFPGAENILDLAETSLLTDETIEKKSGKRRTKEQLAEDWIYEAMKKK